MFCNCQDDFLICFVFPAEGVDKCPLLYAGTLDVQEVHACQHNEKGPGPGSTENIFSSALSRLGATQKTLVRFTGQVAGGLLYLYNKMNKYGGTDESREFQRSAK